MRRVIEGRVYDTDTAKRLACISANGFSRGDWKWDDTDLYRTAKGRFFIAGQGGPLSRWGEPSGTNGRIGGSGIQVLDESEAKDWVARFCTTDVYAECFGPPEEG